MLYGVPPFSPGSRPPGEKALSELRQAIQSESGQNTVIYLTESKKLCMAISEAYNLKGEYARLGQTPPAGLLRTEVQNQLMAFALMRMLSESVVATEAAGSDGPPAGGSPRSRVSWLVERLERHLEATAENEERLAESLAIQPLFRVLSADPPQLAVLEEHLAEVAAKATQLVLGNQEALQLAMQMQLQQQPRL